MAGVPFFSSASGGASVPPSPAGRCVGCHRRRISVGNGRSGGSTGRYGGGNYEDDGGGGGGGGSSCGERVATPRQRLTGPVGAVRVAALVAAAVAVVAVTAALVRGAPLTSGGAGGGVGGGGASGQSALDDPRPPPADGAASAAAAAGVSDMPGASVILPSPPPRVTLLHMYDGASYFGRLGALTGANKARYASRHGYEFVGHTPSGTVGLWEAVPCVTAAAATVGGSVTRRPISDTEMGCFVPRLDFGIDTSRRPTFGKLHLARAACVGRANGWLLWSDADAMVINQSVPIETLIDDAADFVVTADWLMLQAGVFLVKCSEWGMSLLAVAEEDRKYDKARALDQSALQAVLDGNIPLPPLAGEDAPSPLDRHVRWLPKRVLDVYAEEYVPGDFVVHFAGKLYEATEAGLWSIARQFELLSRLDDVADIDAFFSTHYLLNAFSGTCVQARGQPRECKPDDPRRVRLGEPLSSLARSPEGRYRHVGLRYFWLSGWKDKYDTPGWDQRVAPLAVGATAAVVPQGTASVAVPSGGHAAAADGAATVSEGDTPFQEPEDGLVEVGPGAGGHGPSGIGGDSSNGGGSGEDGAPAEDGAVRQQGDSGDSDVVAQHPDFDTDGTGRGVDPDEDDVDGDESDTKGEMGGNEGGWVKWVVIGVLVAGMAGASRVLVMRRRKSPNKAL
ncbi:hypothetical protein MMPV_005260 [Pyropia vietnamensis]